MWPGRGTQGLGPHHSLPRRPLSLVAVTGSRTSGQSQETRGWGLRGRPGTAAQGALPWLKWMQRRVPFYPFRKGAMPIHAQAERCHQEAWDTGLGRRLQCSQGGPAGLQRQWCPRLSL